MKIVAIQPHAGNICAIPEKGDPLPIKQIKGNVKPGVNIEFIDNEWKVTAVGEAAEGC